ncbi:MAG: Choline-sulfatase [Verrucomicrobia bacterium]|nr:Choline-sulfatase [Verrucomicrobiota bacterium]
MIRRFGLCLLGLLTALPVLAAKPRPNVLIILIDDHPSTNCDVFQPSFVPTPGMQRMAARGTWFTHGYDDAPICCASRTALLTGVHATRSGVYYNNQAYRRAKTFISQVTSLPGNFKANGYLTIGYGKIGHNTFLDDDIGDYTPGYYKMLDHKPDVTHADDELLNYIIPGSLHEVLSPATKHWSWGILPDDWDRNDPAKMQQDTEEANRAIAVLREKHEQPFFMICGFYRPHGPWTVPKRFFDQFPLESIQLPVGYKADDLEDVPKPGRWIATNRGEHAAVVAAGMWKKAIQAVNASTAYSDEQVGRVLSALEQGPHREDTIVVFAADNGFHTGEKNHWLKYALWEQTCRVVFSISVPGMPVQRSDTPVSLVDLYPTLNSLCGLPAPKTHELDGEDLSAVLSGKAKDRGKPVLSTYGQGNHSLRNDRYRYIRYRNGAEEFYDEKADPYEWKNLAGDPKYAAEKAALGKWLPTINAPDIAPPPHPAVIYASWEDEAFKE